MRRLFENNNSNKKNAFRFSLFIETEWQNRTDLEADTKTPPTSFVRLSLSDRTEALHRDSEPVNHSLQILCVQ